LIGARPRFHASVAKGRFGITLASRLPWQGGFARPSSDSPDGRGNLAAPRHKMTSETEMIRHSQFLIAVTAVGLSGPVHAETDAASFDQCHGNTQISDASAECIALRDSFQDEIGDCIVEQRVNAERSHAATGTRTAHAYRARYLFCARKVREDHGVSGN
jgi:hypothetical protein